MTLAAVAGVPRKSAHNTRPEVELPTARTIVHHHQNIDQLQIMLDCIDVRDLRLPQINNTQITLVRIKKRRVCNAMMQIHAARQLGAPQRCGFRFQF